MITKSMRAMIEQCDDAGELVTVATTVGKCHGTVALMDEDTVLVFPVYDEASPEDAVDPHPIHIDAAHVIAVRCGSW